MNRGATALFAAVLLAMPGSALAQEKQDMADDEDAAEIAAANAAWAAGFNAGDAAAVAAVYAPDAVVMAPGAEPAVGTAAIQALLEAGLGAAPGLTVTLESLGMNGDDDLMIEYGKFVMTGPDGAHVDHGSYMAAWRETDDGWKIVRDIWNSSMPPAGDGK